MKKVLASILMVMMLVCGTGLGHAAEQGTFAAYLPADVEADEAAGRTGSGDYSFQCDPDAIEATADSVFYVEVYDKDDNPLGTGSGFVTFEEHLFVTNQHVIQDAAYLKVYDDEYNMYVIDQVVVSDKANDIAIMYFPEGIRYRSLVQKAAREELKRGMPVVTMGSPKGFPGTVSTGIVSALPTIGGREFIQISAPISHGSSGGCLFDDQGNVIGVNSYGVDEGQNINFAIPICIAQNLYATWDKTGHEQLGTERSWNTVAFRGPCWVDPNGDIQG